jgi:hypothetical protein
MAYRIPQDEITPETQDLAQWINTITDKVVELTDKAKTFQLETCIFQLHTHLSQITGKDAPEPIVYHHSEHPTELAYYSRRDTLIAEGRYTMPAEIDPENPMPDLPVDQYIPAPPPFPASLSDEERENKVKFVSDWVLKFEDSKLYHYYIDQLKLSRDLLLGLSSDETWELIKEDKSHGVKTYYRAEKDVATHSFRVVGTVRAKCIELFTLIYEIEMFAKWFPQMRECQQIHEISRYKKVCQSTVASIWPMSDRELLLDCGGVDDSDRGRVLINLRDLPKDSPHWFECPSTHVRCAMLSGGFMLIPLTENTTQVTFTTNVDPVVYLPTSILNIITGKMVGTMIQTMSDWAPKTQGEDSPWHPHAVKHHLVYDFVRSEIEKFFIKPEAPIVDVSEDKVGESVIVDAEGKKKE